MVYGKIHLKFQLSPFKGTDCISFLEETIEILKNKAGRDKK